MRKSQNLMTLCQYLMSMEKYGLKSVISAWISAGVVRYKRSILIDRSGRHNTRSVYSSIMDMPVPSPVLQPFGISQLSLREWGHYGTGRPIRARVQRPFSLAPLKTRRRHHINSFSLILKARSGRQSWTHSSQDLCNSLC